jgi:hypothetical protein
MVVSKQENMFDNQELSAFIEATLKAISEGVRNATSEVRAATPTTAHSHDEFRGPKTVDFDVAVSVRHQDGTKKGLSIGVQSVGGKYDKDRVEHSEKVTRVSFSVPWGSAFTEKGQEDAKRRGAKNQADMARMTAGFDPT